MDREAIKRARMERAEQLPFGAARRHFVPAELQAREVTKDGKAYFEVTGFATIFDTPYTMFDAFGEYQETVGGNALNDSLKAGPDVAFLTNHRGITMARTTNGTLELKKRARKEDGKMGLGLTALLNAERVDVRDTASAIVDKLITEMSFAFMVSEDGYVWNEDYTELKFTKIDINRGDVSAVNYGANPFTSIGVRASEILSELRHIPAGAIPAAQRAIVQRVRDEFDEAGDKFAGLYRDAATSAREIYARTQLGDIDLSDIANWEIADETGEYPEDDPADSPEPLADKTETAKGMSLDILGKYMDQYRPTEN